MDVEIERAPKPLDHGHRAPATIRDPTRASASAKEPEYRADEYANDGATQMVMPRQLIPQAVRQAEHPLSHGRVGEHVVDEVGGALGHSAAAATRTDRG